MKTKKQIYFSVNRLPNCARFLICSFFFFGVPVLLLNASACSTVRLQRAQIAEDKRENLPQNMKAAEEDADIAKESSVIISVNDDGGKFLIGKEEVSEAQLTQKIDEKMKDKPPDKRIVYIESAVGVSYRTIVKLLNSIRKADIDKAGLVAFRKNYEKLGAKPGRFEVKLPTEENKDDRQILKPNPLYLVVSIDKSGALRLNMDSMGDVTNTETLINKLTEIFKDRESNGVFREGTNEVEKTVFIKASQSLKYGDVVKVIDALKQAGTQPVGIQIDDLSD
jgi:biopolymer transport protein ExbD